MSSTAEVARAQAEALRHRIPWLYVILAINVVALCCTHLKTNPAWQVVYLPFALVCGLLIRGAFWARLDPTLSDDAQIKTLLRRTVLLGGLTSGILLAWALSLHDLESASFPHSYMTQYGHVDFFIAITVISCMFLMMHLPLGSIVIAIVVIVPFTVQMLATGRVIESAIALNLFLVIAAMVYVAIDFGRDFDRMVQTASELRRVNAQNARLASIDVLTGLPNRRHFFEALERVGAAVEPYAVIVVDLDGFKQINDIYGHNAGDTVLRAMADRLQSAVPQGARLARLGGDEFACVLSGAAAENAKTIAGNMIAICAKPVDCYTFTAKLGASAGVCLPAARPPAPILAYEQADYAVFEAKRAGRMRVECFNGNHADELRRSSSIAHLLRASDLRDELIAMFQPIFTAKDHRICSFETLVRWTSRELGPVGPAEFVQIAERTDLIFDISRYVLTQALLQATTWPEHISVKVNLSVRDLMSRSQTEALAEQLRRSPVDPGRVTFEITETIFAASLEQVRSNVELLRAAGCDIAVDDFGVGYSNLNYLHALAPDVIKIDRSFVQSVASSSVSRRIIRTVVELARNVGARSVAEGVETAAQVMALTGLGCDELQGYYFSKPLSAAAATRLVAATLSLELAS